jgi:hypothetical protein
MSRGKRDEQPEAMSDHKHRSALHELVQRVLHQPLAFGIESGSGCFQRDVNADRESVSNQMPRYWRKAESKPSSRSKIEGFFKMARAMATLCFWPPLSVMPRSAQRRRTISLGSQHKTLLCCATTATRYLPPAFHTSPACAQ